MSWSSTDSKNHGIEPAFVCGEILPLGNKKIGCANPTKDYFEQIL